MKTSHTFSVVSTLLQGPSHQREGLPCQDALASAQSEQFAVAVVCDGMGSSQYSQTGSEFVTRNFCDTLLTLCEKQQRLPTEDEVVTVASNIREELVELAATEGLQANAYACTVVGTVIQTSPQDANEQTGYFVHIGDGTAFVELDQNEENNQTKQAIISLPENGEYSNQTFFLTSHTWKDHLRFTSFSGSINSVWLMTDGVTPFALAKGQQEPAEQFVTDVFVFLNTHTEKQGQRALAELLSSPKAADISDDDKALIVLLPISKKTVQETDAENSTETENTSRLMET